MEKKKKEKFIDATGIGLIVSLIGLWAVLNMFFNTDGGGTGQFGSYAGPVLPMTSLNGAEGVEVSRNVDFDFSPYDTGVEYSNLGKGGAAITDSYDLTNTTGEDITVELVYGFQGQFIDQAEEFPSIEVDGGAVQPELYPSVDVEKLVWNAYSFERYSEVLTEHDFRTIAMEEPELPDVAVTAYHFTDLAYEGTEVAAYPMLVVTYALDENTAVWTDWVDSIGTVEDSDRRRLMFRLDRGEAWIFTIGGELLDLELGGNRDYNIKEDSAIDVTCEMEVFQTTLGAALEQFAQSYDFWAESDYYPNPGFLTPELLLDGALKRMEDFGFLEDVGIFSELFMAVVTEHRMMYLVFPVTIPAGETVTVEASYIQEPSYDISGPKEYREGYDMATKLSSDLNFTDLTASVTNTDRIEIGEQNFGFDLERGIVDVTLDLSVDRYYMEIFLKE